jgi:hypothetical protein
MIRELKEEDLDIGELIDIDEFVGMVVEGEIDDNDGYGLMVRDDEVFDKENPPSEIAFYLDTDGLGITHVLWFKS